MTASPSPASPSRRALGALRGAVPPPRLARLPRAAREGGAGREGGAVRGHDDGAPGPGAGRRTTWSGSAYWTPAETARPGSVAEVADVVRRAAAAGRRVKPIGAGHSFSPIAVTDGVQLELDALSGLTGVDRATGRVRALAGTPLHRLGPLLGAHGLALANMGDIDRQSLAGALSTSTHGTGLGFTGYGGMVTGLRLVTADGAVRWLDARTEPELFQAARVGLGALGVVVEAEIQAVPAFLLRAEERSEPLEDVVASFVERSRAADHLEFYWFPGTSVALTKENTRLPLGSGLDPVPPLRAAVMDRILANGLFEATCRLGARVPRLVPALNAAAARGVDRRTYTDVSHRVFVADRAVRFREMEYALPLERFTEAFTGLRALLADRARGGDPVSFPVEVRTAAADDVWLSTAHGRESVYLAVHRYHREDPADCFRAVEELFLGLGGRPHWGKEHTRDAAWAAEAYPRFGDFLAQRDAVDPGRVFANDHLNRVLGA